MIYDIVRERFTLIHSTYNMMMRRGVLLRRRGRSLLKKRWYGAKKRMVGDKFEYLEVVENLKVERIDMSTGDGLCTYDNAETIRVPTVIKGEVVSARVYRKKDGVVDADLVDVQESSPLRVKPNCELFDSGCSGCQLQHMPIEHQRELKRDFVINILRSYSELSEVRVSKTLGGKNTFGYRTKLTPRFDLPRRRRPDFVPNIGFRERGRFRIADVSKCLIASDAINDVLPKVREEVHNRIDEYARGAQLLLRDDGTGHVITDPREIVTTSICGIKFDYSAHDFFQVNHEVTEILVREVLTRCDFEDVDYVADMYSGCGMFAVHIAAASGESRRVVGVEVSSRAVECARHNADRAGLSNVSFECGQSESIFETLVTNSRFDPDRTCVVIDPPRNGCDESFLSQLVSFAPRRLIYISCHPETLCRDLASLAHIYQVNGEVLPLDMFPQTRHVECVVSLVKKG